MRPNFVAFGPDTFSLRDASGRIEPGAGQFYLGWSWGYALVNNQIQMSEPGLLGAYTPEFRAAVGAWDAQATGTGVKNSVGQQPLALFQS